MYMMWQSNRSDLVVNMTHSRTCSPSMVPSWQLDLVKLPSHASQRSSEWRYLITHVGCCCSDRLKNCFIMQRRHHHRKSDLENTVSVHTPATFTILRLVTVCCDVPAQSHARPLSYCTLLRRRPRVRMSAPEAKQRCTQFGNAVLYMCLHETIYLPANTGPALQTTDTMPTTHYSEAVAGMKNAGSVQNTAVPTPHPQPLAQLHHPLT